MPRTTLPRAALHPRMGAVLVLAAALVAAFAPTATAEQFFGDGTFYGDNGWEGACKGNIGGPWHPGVWPPPGASYISNLQPGNTVPVNVAMNGPQYSTAVCGKLILIKASGADRGCTTCGLTPVPHDWILARVTNVCPECLHGSVDFGVRGDGRWKITWKWAGGVSAQSIGSAQRADVPVFTAVKKKSKHSAAYWAKLKAAKLRSAAKKQKARWAKYWAKIKAKKAAAAKRAQRYKKRKPRKLLAAANLAVQQLPASV